MNQNEQMRDALREIEKKAHDYDGASGSTEIDRWFAEIGFLAKEALAAKPAPIPDAKKMVEPELADAHRTLAKWLNEEIEAPIDRYALAKVLAATCLVSEVAELVGAMEETQRDLTILLGNIYASAKRDKNWEGMYDVVNGWITRNHRALENYEKGAAVKECVTAQPKKLVRLTDDEIKKFGGEHIVFDKFNNFHTFDYKKFSYAIMDAMERKNGGAA